MIDNQKLDSTPEVTRCGEPEPPGWLLEPADCRLDDPGVPAACAASSGKAKESRSPGRLACAVGSMSACAASSDEAACAVDSMSACADSSDKAACAVCVAAKV